MKKHYKKILLFVLFVLIIPFSVHADITCSDISNEIENYNTIVKNMKDLDCDNIEDSEIVAKCNNYNTQKALSLSTLFSYNDENTKCNKRKLEKIVKENKDQCTNIFGTELKDLAHYGLNAFYIIAPFLLLIFGMLDFTKIVTMNNPKTIKESRQKFIKRFICFVLIYIIPVLLNLVLSLGTMRLTYDSNIYSCSTEVRFELQKWTTTYVPQASNNGNGRLSSGSANSIVEAAGKVHEQQKDYHYSVGSDLYFNNIEKSLNNPNKVTCCATFVGTALYVAGIFTEAEMNSYGYNSAPATSAFLASKGWKKITSYNDLQAGDIVFMTSGSSGGGIGHTQLYAGDGTWYNAGGNCAIRDGAGEIAGCGISSSPYKSDASGRFLHAYRKP